MALLSGGKDSFYAAMLRWPPDVGLVLVYEFPEPSPHLANLGKSVETLTLAGIPVLVARLPRGREKEATVKVLRLLGASEVVAGDVYIEDHLRYMEEVASEAGATLHEPLWGEDPAELLHRIVEAGIKPVVIGVRGAPEDLLGAEITADNVDELVDRARRGGWDPLGERGEYHTIVKHSPLHLRELDFEVAGRVKSGKTVYLRLI